MASARTAAEAQPPRHHAAGPALVHAAPLDFHTVTCVAWSACGRNIGLGTPDGLRIFSSEPLVATLSASSYSSSPPPPRLDGGEDGAGLQEVCRCAVYGGVGLLRLYKQSSIVAYAGVQHRSAASCLQLADLSQSPPSSFFSNSAANGNATPRRDRPWPLEEDEAVGQWYERWRSSLFASTGSPPSTVAATAAYVRCPAVLAALDLCAHVIVAATSGDARVAGSHSLHVFDHRLRPLYTLPVYPPSCNAHLQDMIAIAGAFTAANGAGMVVQRLRVLLPGERRGEVRLLTFKKSVLAASAAPSTAAPVSGDSHRLVDCVLHQAPLRAVAISDDGKSGVTMSTQGMRLCLVDFVGDDSIKERLRLDRGRLPAVTDTVSLSITPVPRPGRSSTLAPQQQQLLQRGSWHERCDSDSGVAAHAELPSGQYQLLTEALHDIVVCLTSSGTLHVFGCGQQQVLFYHSDKTLLPRVGYPYNFSVCVPPQLVREATAAVFVTRSSVATSAARLLSRHEKRKETGGAGHPQQEDTAAVGASGDFFAFQLRYPSHLCGNAARIVAEGRDEPRTSILAHCSLAG